MEMDPLFKQVACIVFGAALLIALLALSIGGCAAPWETWGQGAKTIYTGSLAAARGACATEHFRETDDERWRKACATINALPERIGAARPGQRRVRVLPDGEIELSGEP